jgi:multiple sugar transport system ATP-binding protein
LHLKVAEHDVITLTEPHTALSPGETIQIAPLNPIFFDAQGARIT